MTEIFMRVNCVTSLSQLFQISRESRTHNISKYPQYASLRGDNLILYRVCITPPIQSPRCDAYSGIVCSWPLFFMFQTNKSYFCIFYYSARYSYFYGLTSPFFDNPVTLDLLDQNHSPAIETFFKYFYSYFLNVSLLEVRVLTKFVKI